MKKLKIFGVIGENLGDEVLGVAAYEYLNSISEDYEITIAEVIDGKASRNGVKTFLVDRKSLKGIFKLVCQVFSADRVVIGGGSLIQDRLGISFLRGTLPYAFQIFALSKIFNKDVYTLPLGVDALDTRLGRAMAYLLLRYSDGVLVRDELSQVNATKYSKLNSEKFTIVPDPAFLYESSNESVKSDNVLLIALSKENDHLDDCINSIVNVCNSHILKGGSVKLISMDEKEGEDHAVNLTIQKRLNSKSVEVLEPGQSIDFIASSIRSAKAVIAMRLHAAILAFGYSNVFIISRTTKTDAFMRKYGVSGMDLKCVEADRILNWLEYLDSDVVDMQKCRGYIEEAKAGLQSIL